SCNQLGAEVLGLLSARNALARRLSKPDPTRSHHRHARSPGGAGSLQLAEKQRSLPARRALRAVLFRAVRQAQTALVPSEMEGGQSRSTCSRMEPLFGSGRSAGGLKGGRNRATGEFKRTACGSACTRRRIGIGEKPAVRGIPGVAAEAAAANAAKEPPKLTTRRARANAMY